MPKREELEYLLEVLEDLEEQTTSLVEQCHSMAVVTAGDFNKFFNFEESAFKKIDLEVCQMACKVQHAIHHVAEYGE